MATNTIQNARELRTWVGREVQDKNGDKIGKIDALYVDEQTGRPEWMAVSTGLFGTRVSFVPLATAARSQDDVVAVPYAKDRVKDAPQVEADEILSEQDETRLYRHYGLDHAESRGDRDDAMTRSEEQLRVGKTAQPTGRVRLRKWVETEQVTQTVPVAREKARIEREPITEENVDEAMSGPEISGGEHEVVLHEEQVVTDKQTVPRERVRLEKDRDVEDVQVADEVRREQIAVEDDRRRSK